MARDPVSRFEFFELRFVHVTLPLLRDGTPCVEPASRGRIGR